jgi:hypothetical protein
MPANINPIYSLTGDVSNNATTGMGQPITAAANDFTGAGAGNALVFTAGANGGFVKSLRFKAAGTNVASLARIFFNNGAANTTAANNSLFGELVLPATTASTTAMTSPDYEYPIGLALPAGFRIYVGLAVAVASGWVVVPIAGEY